MSFLRALGLHELLVLLALPYAATPVASHYGCAGSIIPISAIKKVGRSKVGRKGNRSGYVSTNRG